jgi:NAD-dependent DNA ligase
LERKKIVHEYHWKNIVFTGALSIPRKEAKIIAESHNATVSDTVSRATTDYLIVGDKPGSKPGTQF